MCSSSTCSAADVAVAVDDWIIVGGDQDRVPLLADSASASEVGAVSVAEPAAEPSCTGRSEAGKPEEAATGTETETKPKSDAADLEFEPQPELDLCFICDCTGSMGRYIAAAQKNIQSIVTRIAEAQHADVRFALVSYRDHPPEDVSYVTRIFPFTRSLQEMKSYVDSMKAAGGGDGPEAVTAALSDALALPWRANATKVAVLIADAPPHGLEPSGDGFPNGDPEGRDPLEIARQMAARSITCYSVGVEPVLGQYKFARDFMCTLAEVTGGQAIALSSAALLADVIVNGSSEEICLTKLGQQVESEVRNVEQAAQLAREQLTHAEVHRRATSNLQARGMVSVQMSTDGSMLNSTPSVWHKPASARPQTLAGAKSELVAMKQSELAGRGQAKGPAVASTRELLAERRRKSGRSCTFALDAPSTPGTASPSAAYLGMGMDAGVGYGTGPGMGSLGALRGGGLGFGEACASESAPAMSMSGPKASTYNRVDMGCITEAQVGRIMRKKGHTV